MNTIMEEYARLAEKHNLPSDPKVFLGQGFRSLEDWRAHVRKKTETRKRMNLILKRYGSFQAYEQVKAKEEQAAKEALALLDPKHHRKEVLEVERRVARTAPLDELFGS